MDPLAGEQGAGTGPPTTSELVEALNQAIARVRAYFGAVTAQLGVTPVQAKALSYLGRPSSLSDLATSLGSDVSNTAHVVRALEAGGLLTREPHEGDRRVRTLTLTDRGAKVRQQLVERAYENSPVFARLSEAERGHLHDLLLRLVREPLEADRDE